MEMTTGYKTFGERITELYQAKHYTRDEIANVLLVTSERMRQIETGITYPNDTESFLLENILHVDIDKLKRGELVMHKTESQIETMIVSALTYVEKSQKNLDQMHGLLSELQQKPDRIQASGKLRPEKVKTDNSEKVRSKKVNTSFAEAKSEFHETAEMTR